MREYFAFLLQLSWDQFNLTLINQNLQSLDHHRAVSVLGPDCLSVSVTGHRTWLEPDWSQAKLPPIVENIRSDWVSPSHLSPPQPSQPGKSEFPVIGDQTEILCWSSQFSVVCKVRMRRETCTDTEEWEQWAGRVQEGRMIRKWIHLLDKTEQS